MVPAAGGNSQYFFFEIQKNVIFAGVLVVRVSQLKPQGGLLYSRGRAWASSDGLERCLGAS